MHYAASKIHLRPKCSRKKSVGCWTAPSPKNKTAHHDGSNVFPPGKWSCPWPLTVWPHQVFPSQSHSFQEKTGPPLSGHLKAPLADSKRNHPSFSPMAWRQSTSPLFRGAALAPHHPRRCWHTLSPRTLPYPLWT